MAFNVSTNVQSVFIDSRIRPGTVFLPSTFTVPGRTLIFKDQYASFSTNAMTLTTNNANQTIDSAITSTINTTALGWQSLIAGNNNKWYTVGGTVINSINTSTVNAFSLSSFNLSTANVSLSTLNFRDQTFASTNQLYVQSTFLYYSYGNTSTIISGTRQSFGGLFTPIRAAFAPNQIANQALWFDAADSNTIQLTNGFVSRWLDKSSNARLASPPIIANNPQYVQTSVVRGLPAIRFANSVTTNQYLLVTPFFQMAQNQALTIFAVYNCTAATYNANFGSFLLAHPGFDCGFMLNYTFSAVPNIYATYYNNANTQFTSQSISISYNTSYITTMGFSNISGTGIRSYVAVNGATTTTNTNASATELNTNRGQLNIGGTAGSGNNVDVCELLLYQTLLNTTQTQQIEGYLAWKWNLVANLPANHPFKNSPP